MQSRPCAKSCVNQKSMLKLFQWARQELRMGETFINAVCAAWTRDTALDGALNALRDHSAGKPHLTSAEMPTATIDRDLHARNALHSHNFTLIQKPACSNSSGALPAKAFGAFR